ncbi:hypothetical protein T261_02311 [Streptomyces lydicus]|nr:hypothetical protein T261_02311 [Streptomyces lydicus]
MLGEAALRVLICGIFLATCGAKPQRQREHGEHGVAGKQMC